MNLLKPFLGAFFLEVGHLTSCSSKEKPELANCQKDFRI
jgi:hypothetical protein